MRAMSTCRTTTRHCEQCGSTDYEDTDLGDQGYSACCNELVVDSSYCRDHHGENDRFQTALDTIVTKAGHASRQAMREAIGYDEWHRITERLLGR